MSYEQRLTFLRRQETVSRYSREADLYLRMDTGLTLKFKFYPYSREVVGTVTACCLSSTVWLNPDGSTVKAWEKHRHSSTADGQGQWACSQCLSLAEETLNLGLNESYIDATVDSIASSLQPLCEPFVHPLEARLEALDLAELIASIYQQVEVEMNSLARREKELGIEKLPVETFTKAFMAVASDYAARGSALIFLPPAS